MCSDSFVRLCLGLYILRSKGIMMVSREILIGKRFFLGRISVGVGWNVQEQDRPGKGTVTIHYIREENSNGAAFLRWCCRGHSHSKESKSGMNTAPSDQLWVGKDMGGTVVQSLKKVKKKNAWKREIDVESKPDGQAAPKLCGHQWLWRYIQCDSLLAPLTFSCGQLLWDPCSLGNFLNTLGNKKTSKILIWNLIEASSSLEVFIYLQKKKKKRKKTKQLRYWGYWLSNCNDNSQ